MSGLDEKLLRLLRRGYQPFNDIVMSIPENNPRLEAIVDLFLKYHDDKNTSKKSTFKTLVNALIPSDGNIIDILRQRIKTTNSYESSTRCSLCGNATDQGIAFNIDGNALHSGPDCWDYLKSFLNDNASLEIEGAELPSYERIKGKFDRELEHEVAGDVIRYIDREWQEDDRLKHAEKLERRMSTVLDQFGKLGIDRRQGFYKYVENMAGNRSFTNIVRDSKNPRIQDILKKYRLKIPVSKADRFELMREILATGIEKLSVNFGNSIDDMRKGYYDIPQLRKETGWIFDEAEEEISFFDAMTVFRYQGEFAGKRKDVIRGMIDKYMDPDQFFKKVYELREFYQKSKETRELFQRDERGKLDKFFKMTVGIEDEVKSDGQNIEDSISTLGSIDRFANLYQLLIANIRKHDVYKKVQEINVQRIMYGGEQIDNDMKGKFMLYEDSRLGKSEDKDFIARRLPYCVSFANDYQNKLQISESEMIGIYHGIIKKGTDEIIWPRTHFLNSTKYIVDGPTKIRLKRLLDMGVEFDVKLRRVLERIVRSPASLMDRNMNNNLYTLFQKNNLLTLEFEGYGASTYGRVELK